MLKKAAKIAIFERDNYTCQGCQKKLPSHYQVINPNPQKDNYLVVDHKNGASNDPENLQALCVTCNSVKAGKSQDNFRLSVALKRLGPCVTYYPSLARSLGLKESIFLCQLIYWTPRGRHEKGDGWIYKSVEEMEKETGLGYKEQARLRKALVERNILEERYERQSHRLYVKVNADVLNSHHLPNGLTLKSQMPSH